MIKLTSIYMSKNKEGESSVQLMLESIYWYYFISHETALYMFPKCCSCWYTTYIHCAYLDIFAFCKWKFSNSEEFMRDISFWCLWLRDLLSVLQGIHARAHNLQLPTGSPFAYTPLCVRFQLRPASWMTSSCVLQ